MWTYEHSNFLVHQIPVLSDNYIYIVQDCHSDSVIVVDPALAEPVQNCCKSLNITPTHILNTHHHWDHTDGNEELIKHYDCQVLGNQADASRIPRLTLGINTDELLHIGSLNIQVLDLVGHTLGHIGFVIDDALFCGDTLFGAGCGRLFEGSYEQMWASLQLIADLDKSTKVYCAHEYTMTNLQFAHEIDADNDVLNQRLADDSEKRRLLQPTIPSTIGIELTTNPFLRPLDSFFCKYFIIQTGQQYDAFQIFKAIRERRNKW